MRIVNAGLSQDKAPFYVDATLSKSGTRSANRKADAKSVKVPSHRLDDLIDPGAEICFLKADCQGCEGDAFLSGSQLLGAGNIKVVMLEFDHTDRARHALSTLQTLSPRPFHCLLIPVGLSFQGEQINDPRLGSAFWRARGGVSFDLLEESLSAQTYPAGGASLHFLMCREPNPSKEQRQCPRSLGCRSRRRFGRLQREED